MGGVPAPLRLQGVPEVDIRMLHETLVGGLQVNCCALRLFNHYNHQEDIE